MHVLLTFATFIAGFFSPLTKKLFVPALFPNRAALFTKSEHIIVMVAEPCFICCIFVAIVRAPAFCLRRYWFPTWFDELWHPEFIQF